MAIHILLNFTEYDDYKLDEFAANIVVKMGANVAIFATPAVPLATLGTAQTNYHNALLAKNQGGSVATSDKKAKREVLLGLLRTQAFYVQQLPGITEAQALLSGFLIADLGHHPAKVMEKPVIEAITNPASTQLGVKLRPVPGATGYEFQTSVNGAAPVSAGFFSSTRGIVLTDRVPGTIYAVQARARSGNNNAGPWSDPVSHMAT